MIVLHACKKYLQKTLDPLFPLFSMLHLCRTLLYVMFRHIENFLEAREVKKFIKIAHLRISSFMTAVPKQLKKNRKKSLRSSA